jgi:hypothetical protein
MRWTPFEQYPQSAPAFHGGGALLMGQNNYYKIMGCAYGAKLFFNQ